jgi:amino acid transporter
MELLDLHGCVRRNQFIRNIRLTFSGRLLNFEVTAFTAVIGFWTDDVHPVVFPIAMLAAYALLNLWSAKFFGETEFWISLMKVILIIGLLIMTFFLMVGVNPQRDAFGFRYWRNPGPMAEYISTGNLGRFQGFFACVLSAGFAVAGPDMLSIIVSQEAIPFALVLLTVASDRLAKP